MIGFDSYCLQLGQLFDTSVNITGRVLSFNENFSSKMTRNMVEQERRNWLN